MWNLILDQVLYFLTFALTRGNNFILFREYKNAEEMKANQTFMQKTGLSGFYSFTKDKGQFNQSGIPKSSYQESNDNVYSPEKTKDLH